VRIWGRGECSLIERVPMRAFGAVRVRVAGRGNNAVGEWSKPVVFKMNPNFDMTGIGVVERLQPDTHYDYQVGHFFSDGELSGVRFSEPDWLDSSGGSFLTASSDPKASRSIVVGSCRYLLKTFLGDFFDDRGDKTFRSINDQIDGKIDGKKRPVHQLLMIGDQIYADDLSALNPDKTVDQFYRRYRDAFGQKHLRRLMSRVPTYMTLDDHEIEDNWPAKASEADWKTLFPVAIHAYQAYQLSHSPNIPVSGGRLKGTPNHLWYSYVDGCTEIFVTDSRTERFLGGGDKSCREMLGPDQFRALKRWLANGSGLVKLVVTSVPFFPDSTGGEGDDKWSGFAAQRIALLEHIEKNHIEPVVFLSGDVHASLSIELHSPSGLRLYSVVSSAFFWPYPHPSARHFRRTGTIDGGRAGPFRLAATTQVVNDDNFTRLTITPSRMIVQVYERKGRQVMQTAHRF